MNKKKWKYKKGDKVICFDDGGSSYLSLGKVYTINMVSVNHIGSFCTLNEISNSHSYYCSRFGYYYEKPLEELCGFLGKINESDFPGSLYEFNKIRDIRHREETLTKEELKYCRGLWDKYNK